VPEWNFALIPRVSARDAFATEKSRGTPYVSPEQYEDISVPAPTALGLGICLAATAFGFALVWHIWWLAIACLLAMPAALVGRAFSEHTETVIPAREVARVHGAWLGEIAASSGVNRDAECSEANRGLAAPDEASQ
jgi:cytochrome o ubiquinol oxidase subunit 1